MPIIYKLIKLRMNILKKALTKDDVKRYQKKTVNDHTTHLSKLNQNSASHRHNFTDINQLIECVSFILFREAPIKSQFIHLSLKKSSRWWKNRFKMEISLFHKIPSSSLCSVPFSSNTSNKSSTIQELTSTTRNKKLLVFWSFWKRC